MCRCPDVIDVHLLEVQSQSLLLILIKIQLNLGHKSGKLAPIKAFLGYDDTDAAC